MALKNKNEKSVEYINIWKNEYWKQCLMVKNGLDMIRYAFKKITHFMQKTQNCKMQMRLNFNFFLKIAYAV